MTQITAAAVKALRDKTQLPMMECKRALKETDGDEEAAIRLLRERGRKTMAKRADRATHAGRIAIHASIDDGVEVPSEGGPDRWITLIWNSEDQYIEYSLRLQPGLNHLWEIELLATRGVDLTGTP